jgi:hypothetical protein
MWEYEGFGRNEQFCWFVGKKKQKIGIVSIPQKFYIRKIVKKFGTWDCKPVIIPFEFEKSLRLEVQDLQENCFENSLVR